MNPIYLFDQSHSIGYNRQSFNLADINLKDLGNLECQKELINQK